MANWYELAVFGGARGIILKVILRLLRVLKDATAVEAAVRRILPEVTSLSSKVELVLQIGHREKSSHKLVSVTTARELETMLRNEIRPATTDELALERDPSRILEFAKHHAGPSEKPFDMDDSPELTFVLLRSVRGQMETLSVDSRVVHRIPVLNWERLIDLYGDTEVLETRIKELKARFNILRPGIETRGMPLADAERLLELADKYLSGWRPEAD